MDDAALVEALVDAYIARRRKGIAFDDTAATQAYWEYAPQFSARQAKAFSERGKSRSVEGWKVVLRAELAKREGGSRTGRRTP
jgi:hypothetical protein